MLLEAKIKRQLAVLDSFGLPSASAVRDTLVFLDHADRIDRVLMAEAKAAEAYWDAWADVPMAFARRDHVPDHWRTFGARRSPLTLRPRNAANPLNAILNYLYTLLESETRIGLIARGLDCGLALFHADEAKRQGLAADVMEPVRPHVDAFVLTSHARARSPQRISVKRARARAVYHRRSRKNLRLQWRHGRSSLRRTPRLSLGTYHASRKTAWVLPRRSGRSHRSIARE